MAKRILRDDVTAATSNRWLSDDYGAHTVVDVLPRMTLFTRKEAGNDEAGDPVFEWSMLIDNQPVAAYSTRREIADGVALEKVRVVALDPGSPVDATCAFRLDWGRSASPEQLLYFRVTSAVPNGLRLDIEAERVV